MIKAAALHTAEIDDIPLACHELKTQLDKSLPLLKNSVGIVQCSPEFIEADIMGLLYEALQIPLVGGTTVSTATNASIGGMMLSILVLTSEDVDFLVSHTEGFGEDCFGAVETSLKKAMAKTGDLSKNAPELVLAFPPIIDAIAGDDYIEAIENICGKIPIFGTLCVDDSLSEFDRSAAVANGMSFKREMTYVLIRGNINPRFFVATVAKQSGIDESDAVITKAQGNVVYEINHMRAIDYFESIGLAGEGKLKEGIVYVPLLITPKDNAGMNPFVRALIRIGSDGSAVFRGKMEEGAKFTFGSNASADVLSSTADVVARIAGEASIHGALLFSCMMRQLVIGADSFRELSMMKEKLADIPFIASYAGGEIAPTGMDGDNNALNRFHNYTFIACLL